MSPKKSNRKTKGSSKTKAPLKAKKPTANATKTKSSDIALAKRKNVAKKIATKLQPTNTSLILESMKRRMAQRKETQVPKGEIVFKKIPQDVEESEAKRILKRIMEERESEERKEEGEVSKDEVEEEEEIPIIIPEIEMKPPEEKVDEEEKIEAEKEEREVDEAKVKEQEEKEEIPEKKFEEKKTLEVDEEEKEMKRFFEPKVQTGEQSRPMPIIPETEAYPAQQKVEDKFNWTRLIIALISAVVLAAAAGYGFMSLGYSNMFAFGGSLLVLVASTAYFYIVLKNM